VENPRSAEASYGGDEHAISPRLNSQENFILPPEAGGRRIKGKRTKSKGLQIQR
jgi:hypothetical protein